MPVEGPAWMQRTRRNNEYIRFYKSKKQSDLKENQFGLVRNTLYDRPTPSLLR